MLVIREVLNFYLNRKVQSHGTQAETEPQTTDNITNAQKVAFAIANNLTPKLDENDISNQMLWDYVKRKFEVDTRNDMNAQQ